MSEYPDEPRAQGRWPAQPPTRSADRDRYQGPPGAAPRRRRRRRRLGIGLLAGLIVVLVAFVAVDFAAKAYAENRIAAKIQSSGLGVKPSVTIEGFPFLTQVAAHDVRAIDISASNVPAGKVTITGITARATGVHLNSSFSGATISQINGTAVITFQSLENDLSGAIGIPGLSIASIVPDPANGPNAVTASAGVAGAAVASVTAKVTRTGPRQITISFGKLGGIASLIGGAASIPPVVINIPKLPAGLIIKSVTVTDQGVVATASATNTTLSQ